MTPAMKIDRIEDHSSGAVATNGSIGQIWLSSEIPVTNETKYSRVDLVNFVEDSLFI